MTSTFSVFTSSLSDYTLQTSSKRFTIFQKWVYLAYQHHLLSWKLYASYTYLRIVSNCCTGGDLFSEWYFYPYSLNICSFQMNIFKSCTCLSIFHSSRQLEYVSSEHYQQGICDIYIIHTAFNQQLSPHILHLLIFPCFLKVCSIWIWRIRGDLLFYVELHFNSNVP